MRGGGGQKMSVFVHAQGIKTVHTGERVKKGQNSVHVVVECFGLTIITYSLLALECKDSFGQVDTYEELLQHLIHFHKICRKFYETTQAAQPPPTPKAEQPKVIDLDGPEVIDLDADEEEAVNVTAPEAMAMVVDSEVVEIDPQVSSFEHLKEFEFLKGHLIS